MDNLGATLICWKNGNGRRFRNRLHDVSCLAPMLLLVACDQGTTIKNEPAAWGSSLGYLILDGQDLQEAQLNQPGDESATDGEMTFVSVNDSQFDTAMRLETLRQPPRLTAIEASLLTEGDIEANASCLLHLMARAAQPQIETGLARLAVSFRLLDGFEEPVFSHEIFIEPTWTSVNIPFDVQGAIDAGEAKVAMGIGTQLQVIDVGNVTIRCFDPDQQLPTLPESSYTYAGRAADAPWREIAARQIDRYRKSELVVKVVDSEGQPVPNADVHIQMTRHAFKFGTTIDAASLSGRAPNDETGGFGEEHTARYRKTLRQLFNIVAFADDLSWKAWSDEERRQVTEEAFTWIETLDFDLRDSQLLANSMASLPDPIQELQGDPEALRQAIADRISSMIGESGGRVVEWDVVSRSIDGHALIDLLGWEEIDDWFSEARAVSDESRLFLSESDVLAGDRLVELVITLSDLLERDVPLDAIGIKGQFNEQPPPIQLVSDRLDQLASFDLPMMITEFNIDTDDASLRADFTGDLMTLAFSHPSVEGFVFSKFWTGSQAKADAAMYQRDWTLNPNAEVYRNLVLDDWWTDEVLRSSAGGDLQTRGFLGDYTIIARKDGLSATASLTLGKDGESIVLQLNKSTSG